MNRIDLKFKELKAANKKAFIPYLTAGYPHLMATEKLILAFEKEGADIVEIGVPFSDPLADGPTIQEASYQALKKGVNLNHIFSLVGRVRQKSSIPLALMTYYNPIFHYGEARFLQRAQDTGVDGLIVPDLPPEEARDFIRLAKKRGIATVFFFSPTTTRARMRAIAGVSTGFIYYVSVAGVTGARRSLPAGLRASIQEAKKITSKPICVGFGISTPQHVRSLSAVADGVIVGSAIIKEIRKCGNQQGMVKQVSRFIRPLIQALRK